MYVYGKSFLYVGVRYKYQNSLISNICEILWERKPFFYGTVLITIHFNTKYSPISSLINPHSVENIEIRKRFFTLSFNLLYISKDIFSYHKINHQYSPPPKIF